MAKDRIIIKKAVGRLQETRYGAIPKFSLSKESVNQIVRYMKDNNLDWINIDLLERKNKEEGKPTHYLAVDDWKPTGDVGSSAGTEENKEPGDLPF